MLHTLVTGLDRRLVEPTIITLFGDSESAYALDARKRGLSTLRFSLSRGGGPRVLTEFLRLTLALRRGRFDIVHCSGDRGLGAAAARLAGVRNRALTIHDLKADRDFGGQLFARLAFSTLYTHVVAVSESVADYVAAFCGVPRQTIEVIYNGVDEAPLASAPAVDVQEVGLDREAPVAIAVARLVPEKGIDRLLEAFRMVTASVPGAALVIVGDGPQRTALQDMVEAFGLQRQVRIVGHKQGVGPWLKSASVFVMPSRTEGLGIAAVEAMALSLPVVASRAGGLPEVVRHGETGLLVDGQRTPGGGAEVDAELLARAMARLLRDPGEAARLGAAGRRLYETRFSAAEFVRRHHELYARIGNREGCAGTLGTDG